MIEAHHLHNIKAISRDIPQSTLDTTSIDLRHNYLIIRQAVVINGQQDHT